MLTRRIIPCLDVRNGRVVKGKQFKDIIDVDTPEVLGKFYSESGADELVFYDITASHEDRKTSLEFVSKVAKELNIPFCVGGGVKTVEDFTDILRKGADKISVNSKSRSFVNSTYNFGTLFTRIYSPSKLSISSSVTSESISKIFLCSSADCHITIPSVV